MLWPADRIELAKLCGVRLVWLLIFMNRVLVLCCCLGFLAKSINCAVAAPPVPEPYVLVTNPPPAQILVPGFTVRQLPVEVNNINNLVYAPDGRLFAFCYNGDVLQLKDTDGDGLEDSKSI